MDESRVYRATASGRYLRTAAVDSGLPRMQVSQPGFIYPLKNSRWLSTVAVRKKETILKRLRLC